MSGKRESIELNSKWTTIVATIATTILAITSLITVYITVTAWKEEREAFRPYLTVKESPRVDLKNGVNFELRFTNSGTHPASNLSSKSLVFDQALAQEPIHHDEFDLANEIPNNTSSSLVIGIDEKLINAKQIDITPLFIVVDLQYDDPILNKSYNQIIYLKWNGVINGVPQPMVHVRVEEKTQITDYLKKFRIDPKARS